MANINSHQEQQQAHNNRQAVFDWWGLSLFFFLLPSSERGASSSSLPLNVDIIMAKLHIVRDDYTFTYVAHVHCFSRGGIGHSHPGKCILCLARLNSPCVFAPLLRVTPRVVGIER